MVRRAKADADPALQRLLLQLDEAKGEAEAWSAEVDRLQARMNERMVKGMPIVAETDDEIIQGAIVRGETVQLDEAKLKRRVGADRFNKVTVSVVDKKKLASAMMTGLIPAEWVAECSTVKPSKPYVRITRKKKAGRTARRKGTR